MPEAMPARRGSTTDTAVDASGALTKPMPTPAMTKPGSSFVQCEPGVIPCIVRSAIPISDMPTPKRMRTGMRVDRRPAIGAATNETSESGRKRSPACSGERCSWFWRYSVR